MGLGRGEGHGEGLGSFSAEAEGEHCEAGDTGHNAADDVPSCPFGEASGEGIADLVGDGVAGVEADDEESDTKDEQGDAENALG